MVQNRIEIIKSILFATVATMMALIFIAPFMTNDYETVKNYNREHGTSFKKLEDIYEETKIEVMSYEVKQSVKDDGIFGKSYTYELSYTTKDGQTVTEKYFAKDEKRIKSDKPATITIRNDSPLSLIDTYTYTFTDENGVSITTK